MRVAVADAALRERIQDATFPIWNEGLTRAAYGRWNEGQLRTAWGRDHLHRLALVDDDGQWLATLKRYRFDAHVDRARMPAVGIGALFTPPEQRGRGYAQQLLELVLQHEAGQGCALALLFSEIGTEYYRRLAFDELALEEVAIAVTLRGGAPAMLVRSGTEADLANIAAMHEVRAAASRFSLARPPELIQYALVKKRLLAGLGAPGQRTTAFFVAEEGAMAVAYVVITMNAGGWTIEEAGDRDPAGARLGAMLQVLLAREPSLRPPVIRAWWPPRFPLPPQVTVTARRRPDDVLMVRPLRGALPRLDADDVFFWHSDYF